jgi:hypothetical protein
MIILAYGQESNADTIQPESDCPLTLGISRPDYTFY